MSAINLSNHTISNKEATFINTCPEAPDPKSILYITKNISKEHDGSLNYIVCGVYIRLASKDPNMLWESFNAGRNIQLDPSNPSKAINSIQFYCDTLEICGHLNVPEANITVYARELIWSGSDASIDTTPLDWATDKAMDASGNTPGRDGVNGRKAGTISIYISENLPQNDHSVRLYASGSRGQNPGLGRNGSNGESRESIRSYSTSMNDSGIKTTHANISFDSDCVYLTYCWKWAASTLYSGTWGNNSFPTNGSDAIPGGKPGEGGNGGKITSNCKALSRCIINRGGPSGASSPSYTGGKAGTPINAYKYDAVCWHSWVKSNATVETKSLSNTQTSDGKNVASKMPATLMGSEPGFTHIDSAQIWLHPLGVQKILLYLRDLLIANQHEKALELANKYLVIYNDHPDYSKDIWNGEEGLSMWVSAQSELASILQKINGNMDYFGNKAGFTPFLSFQSTVKLYADETKRALRTLLLTHWMSAKQRDIQETLKAYPELTDILSDETVKSAGAIVEAEAKIHDSDGRIETLKAELNTLGNELELLRLKLFDQARDDLNKKAQIKFAISMASAICQVIPVGQPALGSIGSMGSVVGKMIVDMDSKKLPDTISEIGKIMDKANTANKKVKDAKEKAEKESKNLKPDEKAAKAKAAIWAQVGDGLGAAMAEISAGVKNLSVPESEVEAELQKLEAQSEDWGKLTEKIRNLNSKKTALFSTIISSLQRIGENYSNISANYAAIISMNQEKAKQSGKASPIISGFISRMDQQARFTLLTYLYLMVKAYETTLLEPIKVDWKLTEMGDKLIELVKPNDGFDASNIGKYIDILAPIYEKNIDTIRNSLISGMNHQENTYTLQMGFSQSQTPDVIDNINNMGRAIIDPVEYGLLLPDQQAARISDIKLTKFEFEDGHSLPKTHNMVISVQPSFNGILRKNEQFYAVYSDEPLKWSWTLVDNNIKPTKPSKSSEDMLNLILGKGSEAIKQKVSLPPIWSDLFIKVSFSPAITGDKRPRIKNLFWEIDCDASPAPEYQKMLIIRHTGNYGGSSVECTKDLGGRSEASNNSIRIYPKGTSVKLKVPNVAGSSLFETWDVIGNQIKCTDVREPEVSFNIHDNTIAQCKWGDAYAAKSSYDLRELVTMETLSSIDPEEIKADQSRYDALVVAVSQRKETVGNLTIHFAPSENAPILGLLETIEDGLLMNENINGWTKINNKGIIGWIRY